MLGRKQAPVPVNHSEVRGECHDQGRGVLSPYANEFTPVKSAANDIACIRMPVRKKPQEFDVKVSWEAYRAQFELLAGQNHWDDQECAVQLATNLKGAAVEVLAQLDNTTRCSYHRLPQALEQRYGTKHQDEVYRARFRTRIRRRGESLQELAQDLESMAHNPANMEVLALLWNIMDKRR